MRQYWRGRHLHVFSTVHSSHIGLVSCTKPDRHNANDFSSKLKKYYGSNPEGT
jgi:hypothetical protein